MMILYIVTMIQILILILFVRLTYVNLRRVTCKYSKDISRNINTIDYKNYEIRYFLTKIHVGITDYSATKMPGVKVNKIPALFIKN